MFSLIDKYKIWINLNGFIFSFRDEYTSNKWNWPGIRYLLFLWQRTLLSGLNNYAFCFVWNMSESKRSDVCVTNKLYISILLFTTCNMLFGTSKSNASILLPKQAINWSGIRMHVYMVMSLVRRPMSYTYMTWIYLYQE